MSKYAGVIVRFENKCLLCKRSPHNDFLPNVWSIPSGHVEEDESDISAAAREFYEETGYMAKDLRYISKMESANGKGDVALFLKSQITSIKFPKLFSILWLYVVLF